MTTIGSMIAILTAAVLLLTAAGNVSAEIEPDKLLPPVSKESSHRQVIIGFEDWDHKGKS